MDTDGVQDVLSMPEVLLGRRDARVAEARGPDVPEVVYGRG